MERVEREERELLAILEAYLMGIMKQMDNPKPDEGSEEEPKEKKGV